VPTDDILELALQKITPEHHRLNLPADFTINLEVTPLLVDTAQQ